MTGPEHFAEAERLLAADPHVGDHETWSRQIAAAQAHATLALAAATAEGNVRSFASHAADKRWTDVLGEPPPINGRPSARGEGT